MGGSNYHAGIATYGNPEIIDYAQGASCTVGNYCSISNGVTILLGGEHRIDTVSTFPFQERGVAPANPMGFSDGDVVIGSDVWIGHGVMILSGVTIGDGAVIGGQAVVAKDVPPYAVVVGNPAEVVRYRFSKEEIQELLAIRWWDWSQDRIRASGFLLTGTDIQDFTRSCSE